MDSVTLAHKVAREHELIGLVSFDYGQRHKKELDYAKACADELNTEHILIDISNIGRQLTGSALTDDLDVPDGHYAEETMKITVVPNRNAIMLSIAFGIASARGAEAVATAVHGGDHFIYPTAVRPSPKASRPCSATRWKAWARSAYSRLTSTPPRRTSPPKD